MRRIVTLLLLVAALACLGEEAMKKSANPFNAGTASEGPG
jgi:hypothetical protein